MSSQLSSSELPSSQGSNAINITAQPLPRRIALAGNPNSGKTTLFNALTGSKYKVANYPGVTVEKKEGRLALEGLGNCTLVDLPGTYSLSGSSQDEQIATKVLLAQWRGQPVPDAIVAVVDSTNLERNLYLVTQLIDSGIPLLVALNMRDLAEKRGIKIYQELLSRALDVPVVSIVAKDGSGLDQLKRELCRLALVGHPSNKRFAWLAEDSPFRTAAERLGRIENPSSSSEVALLAGCALLSEAQVATGHHQQSLPAVRDELSRAGIDPLSFEATHRYRWINGVIKRCCVLAEPNARGHYWEAVDAAITHRIWGTLLFVAIMAFIFQSIFLWAELPMNLIERCFKAIGDYTSQLLPNGNLRSLLVDGILAGVGSVVVFIPQIAILFFFLGLLEDSGYLSRAAFLMDRIMRRFGLQGRSFIPLLSSFACAIPGILSTRTIPSYADRLVTIMVAPLMSCSARLPVYTVLIAAFVPRRFFFGYLSLQGLVLLGMYLLGIIAAASVAWILKLTLLRREPALFVMEMPPFRLPSLRVVFSEVTDRVLTFLKNAGTIILACSIVLWFLASYPKQDENFTGNRVQASYAGQLGTFIEPVIKPLGFNWEIGVSIIASFAAREVFVSSLATVYNLSDDDTASESLITLLKKKKAENDFPLAAALSLMVFYVFACQCMSTLAVTRRETGSWNWTAFMFIYMTGLAYGAALVTYNLLA